MNRSSPQEVAEYYNRLKVETAPLSKKIVMLHDRCVEQILIARDQTGDARRSLLDKAQNILSQLQSALRLNDDIAHGLFYLYDYCYAMLESGDAAQLSNSLAILIVLRDTFRSLAKLS
ncbi:MAG: hypothetical protein GF344_11090 [Chitinivibrionales bacterium]|nr:hypothetical protein [Chitinivibrionales bacterium]MBD3357348.1 hypothetical protein [Chitinivibrionales bacterium]